MVDKSKFATEDEGYRLMVYAKGLQITDAIQNYVREKMSKVERLHGHIMDINVHLDIQRLEHVAAIVVKFEHFVVKVSASSTDMYASIDQAIDRLHEKLRRWKERIQNHHVKKRTAIDMTVNVLRRPYSELDEINAEIEIENRKKEAAKYQIPKVIGQEKMPLKTLTTEEAVMKMDLSDADFLLFRGEEDRKLKVIYRRDDGNYGLMLPE
ncbi:MAG: ribosome hibernation-promoting factor, HPF/YfiA family [Chlamydiales bacterium]